LRARQLHAAVFEGRVTQSMPESVERFASEVAIRTVLHGVVFEVGQLLDAFVEGDGQPSSRIVDSGQRLSDRGSAFFAGVPGIDDGVGMIVGPIHGQGAAVHEYNDKWFAGSLERSQQCLFFSRKIEAGAVTSAETGQLQLHFLALKLRGNAYDRDDRVGLSRCRYGFHERISARREPDQLRRTS